MWPAMSEQTPCDGRMKVVPITSIHPYSRRVKVQIICMKTNYLRCGLRRIVRADDPAFAFHSGHLTCILSGEFQPDARTHAI